MPLGLGEAGAAFLALAVLGAGFVRGYAGFGFSALVVSASAFVTNPLLVVPVVMLLEIAATVGQAPRAWPDLDRRLTLLLLAGAVVALPLAVALLTLLSVDHLRLVISGFILAISLALLMGWTLRRAIGTGGTFGVGLVSGFANAAAVGGLPVALFMTAQAIPARRFRATMIFYLTAIDLAALPMLWLAGVFTRESVVAALLALPLMVLGVTLGGRRFLSTPPESFRRMVIALLAVLAGLGLAKSLI
ncbi:MAG: TSUP family transporter [Rhizobiales bacterium]|nr:TSUP family transporter [Hyphomicrobiales bacterium]